MAKAKTTAPAKSAKGKTPGTPKKRARATEQRDWAPDFLAAFDELGLVTEAARRANVGRSTVYRRREDDEAFAAAWEELEAIVVERMEEEAHRRAVEGVESHKYDKDGNLLWTETKYSDTLLIFLLKARRPGVYRENVKVEHSGPDGGPVQHDIDIGSEKVRGLLDQALAASLEAERASRRD